VIHVLISSPACLGARRELGQFGKERDQIVTVV
jgi:hypothetical protein